MRQVHSRMYALLRIGFNVSQSALERIELMSEKEWVSFLKSLREKPLTTVLEEVDIGIEVREKEEEDKEKDKACAYSQDVRYTVLRTLREYKCVPSFEGFLELYRDRYCKIRAMFGGDAVSLSDAGPGDFCVVMISEIIRKGKVLKVMDYSMMRDIIVPDEYRNYPYTVGSVIGIKFKEGVNDLEVEEILLPDVPYPRKERKSSEHVLAVFTSDIHVGSEKFNESSFRRFTRWLAGDCEDKKLRDLAKGVRYVFIAGDLVDGVDVYPEQYNEITIYSYEEQYNYLGELLEIPREDLKIFAIPGDHDYSIPYLPQLPVARTVSNKLYERGVEMLSNPAYVVAHGVHILLYHGKSLNEIMQVSSIPIQHPAKGMEAMLKLRHLSPSGVPVAPLKEDHLTITEIPDIFHAGHMHINEIGMYRGVLLINAGTFQGLTRYQKERGISPTVGQPVIVDLKEFDEKGKGIKTLML